MDRFWLKALAGATLCVALVCLCYFFLDKPLAFWIAAHHFSQYAFFAMISEIAVVIYAGAFFSLVFLGIKALAGPLTGLQRKLFIMTITVIVTSYIKDILKLVFGRTWPSTWSANNPSLLKDNVYGFNWFHSTTAYQSFPSGHTTALFCAMTFFWFFFPKWRPLALLLCLLEVIGLLAMNYHFLGDVMAGAFLGVFCALAALKIAKLPGVDGFFIGSKG